MVFGMMTNKNSASSNDSDLARLLALASARKLGGLEYAGEVFSLDAYEFIKENVAVVVDVRTAPEWQFVGVPDLSETVSQLINLSWKTYPNFAPNQQFAEVLIAEENITKDTPIFFLCRSGGRSLDAAVAMTALGYKYCFNISGGFEGEPNEAGQRGTKNCWKSANLPWGQG